MPPTGPAFRNTLWRFGFLILLLTAGAAGCAPAVPENAPQDEVNLDALVAEAVETQRAENQNETALRDATLTAAAQQPAVLSAQTLTPTITSTPEFTTTPLPTFPLFDTPTPTPPAAPERNSQDPALRLGEPDWTDSFDNSQNWTEFDGQNSQIKIENGQFRYTVYEASGSPTWTVSGLKISNFYLEVLVQMPAACSGKDRLGLVFRAPDPSQGYRYEISCDGQYRVLVFDDDGAEVIVAWAGSEHVLAGPNQINRLGVWADGKTLAFHINGVALAGLDHNDYRNGAFGFSITSENTHNFTGRFDDLTFWSFP